MSSEKNILQQLEQFIENDSTHVGHKESFGDKGIFMPIEEFKEKMREFSSNIQKGVGTQNKIYEKI